MAAFVHAKDAAKRDHSRDRVRLYGDLAEMIGILDRYDDHERTGAAMVTFLTDLPTPFLVQLGKAVRYSYETMDMLDDLCLATLAKRSMEGDAEAQAHVEVEIAEANPEAALFGGRGGGTKPMMS